jgi:thymidylate synthase (FAD)
MDLIFDNNDPSLRLERPRNPRLDDVLGLPVRVLDHGFVRVIDYMGDDAAIAQAARVSYGAGTRQVSEDVALIRYLLRHAHTSPFEMVELKLHLKVPIFVARQIVRTRTASMNEESLRYSLPSDDQYEPEDGRLQRQSRDNKQGSGAALPEGLREEVLGEITVLQDAAREVYDYLVSDDVDLARELARIVLPLSTYTQFYWKLDLHNLFRFLEQRLDAHAQHEVRAYAREIEKVVRLLVPQAHAAFVEYRRDARTFSSTELAVLHEALAGADLERTARGFGLKGRELREFLAKVA